ncbi:hypothetical protein ILYODFUR_008610 [Ilyodon furcidens]|uniref:Uncharacterized protein n=1 Tax=Ilyodon furcidens TaxID=33524 RepID=A0ABV0THB1_9TELE
MKCSKMSWEMAVLTVGFIKQSGPTPADDMEPQLITDCGNFTLNFKQCGFCASSVFLQTLGLCKLNANFTFISKEGFGTLSNTPVLRPSKMFLTSLVQDRICLCVVALDALTPASVYSL